jgi:hypothetical protein
MKEAAPDVPNKRIFTVIRMSEKVEIKIEIKIWLDRTQSTKKTKQNLPQRIRMEPARKKVTWTPQSHLEAHCFGGMWENIIWRTTSSSQKPPPMEAEEKWSKWSSGVWL